MLKVEIEKIPDAELTNTPKELSNVEFVVGKTYILKNPFKPTRAQNCNWFDQLPFPSGTIVRCTYNYRNTLYFQVVDQGKKVFRVFKDDPRIESFILLS